MADEPAAPINGVAPGAAPGLRRAVGHVRYLAAAPVLGLLVTTLATIGLAAGKTAKLVDKLLSGGWGDEVAVVLVLEAIDAYLLAVVQLIVVLGLFELFIGDLDLPGWLETRSLDDLKKPIVDFLIVFIAIKGVESLVVVGRTTTDTLTSVGAAALLIAALSVFRLLTTKGAARS